MKKKTNKFNYQAMNTEQRDNLDHFAEFLEYTKSRNLQLTTEQQASYAYSFFKYMLATNFEPFTPKKKRTFGKGAKFNLIVGSVGCGLTMLLIVFFVSLLGSIFKTSTLTSPQKLLLGVVGVAIIFTILTFTTHMWNKIGSNIEKYVNVRTLKIGELYYYDPKCDYKSRLLFSPILVQLMSFEKINGKYNIVCIDCESGAYIVITDPNKLMPIRKNEVNNRMQYTAVRLPAAFPCISNDDLKIIDTAIIDAKACKHDLLVNALIELRGKAAYFMKNKFSDEETSDRYKRTLELIDDLMDAAKEAMKMRPDNPMNALSPDTRRMIEELKKHGTDIMVFRDGEDNEEFIKGMQEFLGKFNANSNDDNYDFDEDDDDE